MISVRRACAFAMLLYCNADSAIAEELWRRFDSLDAATNFCAVELSPGKQIQFLCPSRMQSESLVCFVGTPSGCLKPCVCIFVRRQQPDKAILVHLSKYTIDNCQGVIEQMIPVGIARSGESVVQTEVFDTSPVNNQGVVTTFLKVSHDLEVEAVVVNTESSTAERLALMCFADGAYAIDSAHTVDGSRCLTFVGENESFSLHATHNVASMWQEMDGDVPASLLYWERENDRAVVFTNGPGGWLIASGGSQPSLSMSVPNEKCIPIVSESGQLFLMRWKSGDLGDELGFDLCDVCRYATGDSSLDAFEKCMEIRGPILSPPNTLSANGRYLVCWGGLLEFSRNVFDLDSGVRIATVNEDKVGFREICSISNDGTAYYFDTIAQQLMAYNVLSDSPAVKIASVAGTP